MYCARCVGNLDLISINLDKSKVEITREYYCTKCNSAFIEKYIENNYYGSDWIDFNG